MEQEKKYVSVEIIATASEKCHKFEAELTDGDTEDTKETKEALGKILQKIKDQQNENTGTD